MDAPETILEPFDIFQEATPVLQDWQRHAKPDPFPPYSHFSETSYEAARSMNNRTEPMREQIFKLLQERPMTDEEIGEALGLKGDTVRPRRGELLAKGRIKDVGTRLTKSLRNAVVWGVVELPS